MSDEVNILFTGDYHIYGAFETFIKRAPHHKIFNKNFLDIVTTSDLSIFNLEDPITNSRKGILKYGPYGVGSEESLVPIKGAGFNLATFATNHTYDMGDKGISDTLEACKKNGLDVIGAGLTKDESKKIYYKKFDQITIAILNFARKEFNIVTDDHGGANPLDIIDNVKDIQKAKSKSDFVFVVVHDGLDLFYLPYPELVKQMRFYAEMGANAIICHHARLISGYEIYQKVPIFYGLGNLIHMSKMKDEHEGISVLFKVKKGNAVNFEILPLVFDPDNVLLSIAIGDRYKQIQDKVEEYSRIIENTQNLKYEWQGFIKNRKGQYINILAGWPNIIYRIFRKLKLEGIYLKILLFNKKRMLAVWNILRCQAHYEAVNHILTEEFKKQS